MLINNALSMTIVEMWSKPHR